MNTTFTAVQGIIMQGDTSDQTFMTYSSGFLCSHQRRAVEDYKRDSSTFHQNMRESYESNGILIGCFVLFSINVKYSARQTVIVTCHHSLVVAVFISQRKQATLTEQGCVRMHYAHNMLVHAVMCLCTLKTNGLFLFFSMCQRV